MRKRLIPISLLFAALYACKKDPAINPDEVRLLKTERVDSAGNVYNTIFEFDQAGRIAKVSAASNNGAPSLYFDVVYSGNAATISHGAVSTGPVYHYDNVTYVLNNDHQPIQRITYDSLSVSPPENPQRTIKKDTARYEYDAAGLLKKVTGVFTDSTWFDPGIVQTTIHRRTYTRDYTNSNGKLTGITTHAKELLILKILPFQSTSSSTIEATHTFEYIHNAANKTDFVNAWLLAELRMLYDPVYPLNKSYSYFPEKVTFSEVTTNDANGQITGTDSYSRTLMVDHTKYGFIASFAPVGRPQDKVKLIYNR